MCPVAVDGLAAIEKAKSLKVDTVILDSVISNPGFLEAVAIIRKELRESEILILGQPGSEQMLPVTLRAGTRGLVLKTKTDCKSLSAIELA